MSVKKSILWSKEYQNQSYHSLFARIRIGAYFIQPCCDKLRQKERPSMIEEGESIVLHHTTSLSAGWVIYNKLQGKTRSK